MAALYQPHRTPASSSSFFRVSEHLCFLRLLATRVVGRQGGTLVQSSGSAETRCSVTQYPHACAQQKHRPLLVPAPAPRSHLEAHLSSEVCSRARRHFGLYTLHAYNCSGWHKKSTREEVRGSLTLLRFAFWLKTAQGPAPLSRPETCATDLI